MNKSITLVIVAVLLLEVMITGCGAPEALPEMMTETATAVTTETLPPVSTASSSSCGPYQEVDVSLGTYDCEQYTSAEQIFTCNLRQIPIHEGISEGYGIVSDYPIDKFEGGGLYARNFQIENYYVEYFKKAGLPEGVQTLLSNGDTREQGLNNVFENVLLKARSSQVPENEIKVVRNDFLEDGILVVELYADAELAVLQEATYIFVNSEYFYFVTYETVINYVSKENFGSQNHSSAELESYVDELYSACEFNR